LTSLVIVNAILLKFTEQIGPYIFKRVKTNQLAKTGVVDVKVNDAIKQAETMTPFEVINTFLMFFAIYISGLFFVGNLWRLSDYF
jgi:hypothetical protein